MIKLSCKVPNRVEVALSGGPDSMAALHFLKNSNREVTAAFFHHGTETSEASYKRVLHACDALNVPLRIGKITSHGHEVKNLEATWRQERYEFFSYYKCLS